MVTVKSKQCALCRNRRNLIIFQGVEWDRSYLKELKDSGRYAQRKALNRGNIDIGPYYYRKCPI